MSTPLSKLVVKLVQAGYTDQALQVLSLKEKTAMNDPFALFRSIDSLVKRNNGLWKSEKQGKFLLDEVSSQQYTRPEATAWAKRQGIPFIRATFYQTSLEGFGKKDLTKIRMRAMVYLFDKGGVVLRGKVKVNHPKGGKGGFEPDWGHVDVNFRRPKDVIPEILVGDPDHLRAQQVKKNKPMMELIKKVPNWESKQILKDFMRQLEAGYTLSPAQIAVIKRMTPDGFSLSDKEQWQENFDKYVAGIVEKVLPAKIKVFEALQKEESDDFTSQLRELDNAVREYKQRGYTTESWIGSQVTYELEELAQYRAAAASIYADASEYVVDQHKRAMNSKKPTKKAIKIETFIEKAATKLESMSTQKAEQWQQVMMKQ